MRLHRPRPERPPVVTARRAMWRAGGLLAAANLVGASLSWLYLAVISPNPPEITDAIQADIRQTSIVTFAVFMAVSALVVGPIVNARANRVAGWAGEGRPPAPDEVEGVLAFPRWLLVAAQSVWLCAAVTFGVQQATFDVGPLLVWRVVTGILLGGLITSTLTYLSVERTLRPLAGLVLSYGVLDRPRAPGILPRIVVSWLLGSGLPLLSVGLTQTIRTPQERQQLTGAIWFLVAVGLVTGAAIMVIAGKSVAEPIRDLRELQREVQLGRYDVRVAVSDASEVGLLQTGFNEMVAGLDERRRLQDLFGRHVGEDVARQALERGIELGGEVRDVSVLFADVVGSTTLAAQRPADELLRGLNAFFGAVVHAARTEGGWVNKFAGDGALCVFGAPGDLPGHRAAALRAAGRLRDLLAALPASYGIEAAIGVSSGTVTAGNVGAEERFEYTVIGDPVNEAARLTELAKTAPGRVLASGPTVAGAGADGAAWRGVGAETLRGRSAPTELYAPG
ncbi:MAG TPA: adenylate/guanylate cyclase domain-containing protein [Frankiaceae bacterium]|nr:adenylate/guanylate cyclase domain-containing protein [Frankiaceae bacterium]